MAKEQNVLLDVLLDIYDDADEGFLSSYISLQGEIVIKSIAKTLYTLNVPEGDRNSAKCTVKIDVKASYIDYSCSCLFGGLLDETCAHVPISIIYILNKIHAISFQEIAKKLGSDLPLSELSLPAANQPIPIPDKTIKNITPFIGANPIPLPTQETWKVFNSLPQAIFQAIYNNFNGASSWTLVKKVKLLQFDKERVQHTFQYQQDKAKIFTSAIRYDQQDAFYYQCNCSEATRMCSHVKAAFEYINQVNGRSFYVQYKDVTREKNLLLKQYGLTMNDPESKDFIFSNDYWGNMTVKPPAWLWNADVTTGVKTLKNVIGSTEGAGGRPQTFNTFIDFEPGFVFNLTSKHFKIDFELEPMKVSVKADKFTYKKLTIHQNDNHALLKDLPDELYTLLLSLTDEQVRQHLIGKGHTYLAHYVASNWNNLNDDGVKALKRYYVSVIWKMWPLLLDQPHICILRSGSFSTGNIKPVGMSRERLQFSFKVTEDEKLITFRLQYELNGEVVMPTDVTLHNGFLAEIDNVLYMPAELSDIEMLGQFAYGFIKIPSSARPEVIRNIIPLLERRYKVYAPASLGNEKMQADMKPFVLLKEEENKFLVLQPQYEYNEYVVDYEQMPENIFTTTTEGKHISIERDVNAERQFFNAVKMLHPKFQKQTSTSAFFLPFEDTMVKNWFIETVRQLLDSGIRVEGMQNLNKHKYNANKPKWEMKAGSGIDWFDMKIEVTFGDQVVPLKTLRKALLNRQNIVALGDGTFGVLPEEWLAQYGMLMKMGDEQKDGTLRVSKMHYTLIDELHAQIDDEEILKEIADKKLRLLNIGDIKTVKPSKEIKATLRPYQLSGFQWFQTLDEMGWGGCLADDMGLGKTLQAITFLQYLKAKYPGGTHLVICPTSLIYNWESELQKFAPKLNYHIYYGIEREFSDAHFNDYDVIITSYGIVRNDIEEMMKFGWHYVILDESQAIKNPEAQINKALQLLKSKNRMILSGTPIQNNTFDIFAQFHFINPGLLGNKDFFKSEFANPIDKNNDTEKSEQLRRLIFPFMLRRTKQQVATDLPDKTETILWCEMGRDQQAVYNDYKEHYRTSLLKKIEEVGMAKAGMYVLEGLLRLRQICDSPQLVKDNNVTTTKSIKIDELMREISENSGGHKLLVFSQFTEMLHLIEGKLLEEKVSYSYLDGSTPAEKRRDAVDKFQNDPAIRVFLISLKAGGVGLNLTAADYVYIVDPWWNPAVEQQAIDRTHRIGQTNKIFAYKMICKGTVEEKIVQLQQRKKQLANDLVTEDAGFIKKMTKDDVAFLFS